MEIPLGEKPTTKEIPQKLSIIPFHAFRYCFDSLLCEKINSLFKNINRSIKKTETLYNQQIYSEEKNDDL